MNIGKAVAVIAAAILGGLLPLRAEWVAGRILSADEADALTEAFHAVEIPAAVRTRMAGKSYPERGALIGLSELRYIPLLHVTPDGEIRTGEIIVNRSIADDVEQIFRRLYEMGYPIERVQLIDDYGASDEASMRANNSSSFCYRLKAGGQKTLSKHARGLAIDINPLYNPYFKVVRNAAGDSIGYRAIEPATAAPYADRGRPFPMKLTADDPAVLLFKSHGFKWGGDWRTVKDYQHFEK